MMKLLSIIVLVSVTIASRVYVPADELEKESPNAAFSWVGTWNFNVSTSAGIINMTVKVLPDGNGFKGRHCMVDGRILGGANDCADLTGSEPEYTLTNSVVINNSTLEFDFVSGYTGTNGKVRLIKVSDSQIRFIVTEEPSRFVVSPLGSYLHLNNGIGTNAAGGVQLTKQ